MIFTLCCGSDGPFMWRPPFQCRQRLQPVMKYSQFPLQIFIVGQSGPVCFNSLTWDTVAQIRIAFTGHALVLPLLTKPVVTITLGTTGQEYALCVPASNDKIKKRWWQCGNTG
jgi:hypothetical protein